MRSVDGVSALAVAECEGRGASNFSAVGEFGVEDRPVEVAFSDEAGLLCSARSRKCAVFCRDSANVGVLVGDVVR